MRRTSILGTIAAFALAGSAAAADATPQAEVVALAHKAIDAFNKGDVSVVKSTMAADVRIIDEMPPFSWGGPGAGDAWLASVEADNARMKDSDGFSVLDAPTYVRVDGDRVYADFPDHFQYKRAGVLVREDATWTIVAEKRPAGWVIAAWTFSAAKH